MTRDFSTRTIISMETRGFDNVLFSSFSISHFSPLITINSDPIIVENKKTGHAATKLARAGDKKTKAL